MIDLKDLVKISRRYGGDSDYLLAGGGNTSLKKDGVLYVKASGFALSDITEAGFVKMSMDSLEKIWDKKYPEDSAERESEVLADMMSARLPGENARPSVEALLHSLIKGKYVIHTHPALVNGLTCGLDGSKSVKELFGSSAMWVPLMNPGFLLASGVRSSISEFVNSGNQYPQILFLQNHGLFVSAETINEAEEIHNEVMEKLTEKLVKKPLDTESLVSGDEYKSFLAEALNVFGKGTEVRGGTGADIIRFASSDDAFTGLQIPFDPDQIVYSGPGPIRIDHISDLAEAVSRYKKRWDREPRVIFVKDTGVFAVGETRIKADTALLLLLDAIKIFVYSESFGGPNPMSKDLINFILNWEVERYRSSILKG